MKQDSLIALQVSRFPDLFGNLNLFIFARRVILVILIFFYICFDTYISLIFVTIVLIPAAEINAVYRLAVKVL